MQHIRVVSFCIILDKGFREVAYCGTLLYFHQKWKQNEFMQIFQKLRWGGRVVLLFAQSCCRLLNNFIHFLFWEYFCNLGGCVVVVLEGIVLSVNKWVMSCGRPQQRDHSSDKRKEKRQKLTIKSKHSKRSVVTPR